jgi:MFS family permease
MSGLVVGRAVQGIAGGGLIQMVVITISDVFSMRYVIDTFAQNDGMESTKGLIRAGVDLSYLVSSRWCGVLQAEQAPY